MSNNTLSDVIAISKAVSNVRIIKAAAIFKTGVTDAKKFLIQTVKGSN